MKILLLLGLVAALTQDGGASVPAPAKPSPSAVALAGQLRTARMDLRALDGGSFSGNGWERMLQEGSRTQFFVVGEQHGAADIIEFSRALHAELAQRGYTHAALEVGPHSTAKVESLIRSGPGALETYMQAHRGVFAFLGWKEEVRLAEQYVRLSPARTALWGLDQEYVGAAPVLLELLGARQRTPAQRAAVARLAAAAAANRTLVLDLRPSDVQPLVEAFRDDRRALEIIEDYRLSGEIYEPFTMRGRGKNRYWANLTRENYMKRNFATAFSEAERRDERVPKVFMKVGGNHAMRGFSSSTVPALGNFLAEWGVPRGFGTVTVMVDCISDQPNPSCRPYFGADHAVYAAASADKYTLMDLRPVRAQLGAFAGADPKTRDLVQAFDFYVLIRDVKRATPALTVSASPSAPVPSGAAAQP